MNQKGKIPKTLEQRLIDCEAHLYFLWDARRLYVRQKDRFKQIASELRVLVGDQRPSRRLLLSLMEEYDFSCEVYSPCPPFDKRPIPLVGWRKDPAWQGLQDELHDAGEDQEKIEAALKRFEAMRRPLSFFEFIEKALAATIRDYDYSYRELVLAVAQQLGSSHEDTTVEEPLVLMQKFVLGRDEGHVAPLIVLTDLVLEISSKFLSFLTDHHGYNSRYFIKDSNGQMMPLEPHDEPPFIPSVVSSDKVGNEVQKEGSLGCWLIHKHQDWLTNLDRYDFGVFKAGGVCLHSVKEPDKHLYLHISSSLGSLTVKLPIPQSEVNGLPLTVTWKSAEFTIYLNGELCQTVSLSRPINDK